MNLENITIKESTTLFDRICAIENIADSGFVTADSDKGIRYTPYFLEIQEINEFVKLYVEGLDLADMENIYDVVSGDDELYGFIFAAMAMHLEFSDIREQAKDIIEFRKAQYANQASADKLFSIINSVLKDLTSQIDINALKEADTPS